MEIFSFDKGVELQEVVLELEHDWLSSLPVSEPLREDIFEHLCMVTGKMLDGIMDPEKFNRLMTPD